ncbi:hypothetical protein EYZ11_003387 [Aspergillus tanneri]|uniref:Uncharacterized protein n=1 Tax=Aspergillus tanneri TaxID=1220188 RepID=A0A4V3UQ02_9EURO|nr:hypothetical protein EYZ11_003387 [Aspergillus tanneri]
MCPIQGCPQSDALLVFSEPMDQPLTHAYMLLTDRIYELFKLPDSLFLRLEESVKGSTIFLATHSE